VSDVGCPARPAARGGAGEAMAHESASLHVRGEATYTDDLPELRGTLHGAFGLSARAHARVMLLDLEPVRAAPGVVAVLSAADFPARGSPGQGATAIRSWPARRWSTSGSPSSW